MWFWWWGSGPLNISLLPKVAKPGTGVSETGELSVLLQAAWAVEDEAGVGDAGADVALVGVIVSFSASEGGPVTCAGLVVPAPWV